MVKEQKKGISMIVLVITIIVILILSGIVILNLTKGGIFDSAKKATFMSDFRSVEDAVNLYSISNIDSSNSTDYKLPLENKLSLSDKQEITEKIPTLKTKIEELNTGKTLEDVNLYYINEQQIDVGNIPSNKQEKGYIIDVDTKQIYDYIGEFFEGKRWHTLDGGVTEVANEVATDEIQEIWDGWIKLSLYYPKSSTYKQWRLGSQGELRVDKTLMWQNYTGPITIPLNRTKDIWIRYNLNGKTVTIPPAGTLLVDIAPSPTLPDRTDAVKVNITYDDTAEVKEYKIGNGGWLTYKGEFTVTENCIIEARAKKTENVYDTNGALLETRDVAGSDKVYIGNIGNMGLEIPSDDPTKPIPKDEIKIEESDPALEAPIIERLPAIGSEKARVKITYPEGAVQKIYKINYGVKQTYENEISITEWGTTVIAYYYDASGKKSNTTLILINEVPTPPEPYIPNPPYISGGKLPYDPATPPNINLPAPTIERLPAVNGDEKARVKITYPADADKKIYTKNYSPEKEYTEEISITEWDTRVTAYYYDADSNKSRARTILITEVPSASENYPPATIEPETVIRAPHISITPDKAIVEQVSVAVTSPVDAVKTYIKIGNLSEYVEYTAPVTVTENNTEIYAYYETADSQKSNEAHVRVTNIEYKTPYLVIDADPYPWKGSSITDKVTISLRYRNANKVEYSEDGIIYQPYTAAFVVTKNERVYARATNLNGVTEETLDINNIGDVTGKDSGGGIIPPTKPEVLGVVINAVPDPDVSSLRVDKVNISIEYDSKATEKLYRINSDGELKTYTGPFDVSDSCTIFAYAKSDTAKGYTSKVVDNLLTGIATPRILIDPTQNQIANKVKVTIRYDRYANIKKYSLDSGPLQDYTGEIEVTKNGTKVYAYNENAAGQKAESTYTIQNIIPDPPVLVLDKGSYYIIKLSYPDISKVRQYKWKETGEWKNYNANGILLVKPQYKDQLVKEGLIVKVEDDNGNKIDYTGNWYLIDVPISQLSESLFMRWDMEALSTPEILPNTTQPAKEIKVNINYDTTSVVKQYKIVEPGQSSSNIDWLNYTGEITINRKGTIVYAKSQDSLEMWSSVGTFTANNIDETSPVITLSGDFETTQQKVPVKVAVTDDTKVETVKWAEGIKGESYFVNDGIGIENNSNIEIVSNGYYTFFAEDSVGNTQVYTLNVINLDVDKPVVTFEPNGSTITIKQASPKATVLDTGSGIDNSSLKYVWSTSQTEPTTGWNSFVNAANLTYGNVQGSYYLWISSTDSVGNLSKTRSEPFLIDGVAPTTPVITPNITGNTGGPITVTINYAADSVENKYAIDDGAFQTYTGPLNITDNCTIIATSKDDMGNTSSSSLTIINIVGQADAGAIQQVPPDGWIGIYNIDQLLAVRNDLTKKYILMKNIDVGVAPYNTGLGWTPIGNGTTQFTGQFDGNGLKVKNLYINNTSTYNGLFGYTSGGTITNLTIDSANITGGNYTAGLVGYNSGTTMTNSSVIGTVVGTTYTGGLIGYNLNANITNCSSMGTVNGADSTGGLIGYNYVNVNSRSITNAYSTSTVNGTTNIGGLIGNNYNNPNGVNNITSVYATGNVTGSSNYVGGLIGYEYNYGNAAAYITTINKAYASGTVKSTSGNYVGGLIGCHNYSTTTGRSKVMNSYAIGSATGNSSIGGLVGSLNYLDITNTYAIGKVTGNSNSGGLVGSSSNSTATNSYWNTETSLIATSTLGTGKTTSQMYQSATYTGWDFTTIWNIIEGSNYPSLR